jgi:hypothetical protein
VLRITSVHQHTSLPEFVSLDLRRRFDDLMPMPANFRNH